MRERSPRNHAPSASSLALAVLAAGWVLLSAREAQAYLDPGSMSFVFQTIAAAVLGALITLKLQWHRVKASVRKLFASKKKEEQA